MLYTISYYSQRRSRDFLVSAKTELTETSNILPWAKQNWRVREVQYKWNPKSTVKSRAAIQWIGKFNLHHFWMKDFWIKWKIWKNFEILTCINRSQILSRYSNNHDIQYWNFCWFRWVILNEKTFLFLWVLFELFFIIEKILDEENEGKLFQDKWDKRSFPLVSIKEWKARDTRVLTVDTLMRSEWRTDHREATRPTFE